MLLSILCEAADTVIAPKTRVQSTSSDERLDLCVLV